ncbi:MAG: glycosyltransferase family 2 protein [Nanoarchaeota archaeon]|nr:glycosyltransferase family 2 protein [Nanoarchaeota archaeon]MCG2718014.1 glycosyltransferase family 2 protein [Nanoarchaeota archaeon]
MKQNIIAILPAYNQEKNMAQIIEQVKKHVSQIIVVADGSIDKTAEVAAESGAIVPEHTLKRGKGNAVIRGIETSKSLNPDIIVLMDSDGQHNSEEIPKLLKPIIENEADMVLGSRLLGILKTSNINKIGNHLLNSLHFLLTFKWVTDAESGFRVFKAKKLYELNLIAPRYEIESDTLLEAIDKKLRIKEVPISIVKEEKGITLLDGLKIGKFIIAKRIKLFLK